MRKNNTQPLSEVLRQYVETLKLNPRYREVQIKKIWKEIMPKAIVGSTSSIFLKDGVLFIQLNSSVARNELLMMREAIRQVMNKKLNSEAIKEIVLR
jgi:hypothetical protein